MTLIGDIILVILAFGAGGYCGYKYGSRAVAAAQAVSSDVTNATK